MKTRTLLVLLFSAIVGWSCKDSGSDPGPSSSVPDGAFAYTGYNNAGRIEETGWLLLDISDPEHVVGIWQLSSMGIGELHGSIQNGSVIVDLHPGYADNNYILNGAIQRGDFSGLWTQVGFAGIMASGKFVAHHR